MRPALPTLGRSLGLSHRLSRPLCSSSFSVPPHLRQTFYTPAPPGRVMIVGKPFWNYPIAVVPPRTEVAPLITAIRALDRSARPFRIISHEDDTGRVFNASFFDDQQTMDAFLAWCVCTRPQAMREREHAGLTNPRESMGIVCTALGP